MEQQLPPSREEYRSLQTWGPRHDFATRVCRNTNVSTADPTGNTRLPSCIGHERRILPHCYRRIHRICRTVCQTSLGAQHISQASLITQGAVQLAANEKSEPPLMYPTQPARKLSHLSKLHIDVQSNKELYVPVWKRGGLKDMAKRSSEVKAPSHIAQKVRNNVLSSVKTECPSKSEGVPKCSKVETKKKKILYSAAKDQVPQTALQKKVKPMSKPVNHSSAPIPGKSPHGPQSGDEAVLLKKMKRVCLSGAHISNKVSEKMQQSREGTMDAKTPAVTHINPKLKKTQEIGIKRKDAKTPAVTHSPERKTPQEMGIKRKYAKTPAVTHSPERKTPQEMGIKLKNAKTPAVTHCPERKTPQEIGIKRKYAKTPAVTHSPERKTPQEMGIKCKDAKSPAVTHSPERKTPQEMGIKRKQNSNIKQLVKKTKNQTSVFSFEQALACGTDNNPKALKRKSANQPGVNSEVLGKGKKSLEPSEQGKVKAHHSNLSLQMINSVQVFHPLGKKAGPTGPGAPAESITLGNKLGPMQGRQSQTSASHVQWSLTDAIKRFMAKKQDSISGIKGVGINARPRLFKIHEYTRPDIKTSEIKQRGENKASVIENPKHFPVISIERKAAVTCIKKVSQTTIPIQAPFNQKHQLSNLQLPINVPSRVDNFTPSF
ncbi:hypothetical protein FKM82_020403, partial [Ascaphus truei]